MRDNLWGGVFNLLTPEYQAERKKKEDAEADFDFHQRRPLLQLLDKAEDVFNVFSIRRKGISNMRYVDLLNSFLFLYASSARIKIGHEVVLFFNKLMCEADYISRLRRSGERLTEYYRAKERMVLDVERLKVRVKAALPDNVEIEVQID